MTFQTSKAVLLDAGGHTRVVCGGIEGEVIGCLGPVLPDARWPQEIPWLGGDDALEGLDPEDVLVLNGVADTARRIMLFDLVTAKGFALATVVPRLAGILDRVEILEDAQIMAGALVQCDSRIGRNALINTGAIVEHDCVVEDDAHVAPGAILCGNVTVGAQAHVGAGATVIQGVRIGSGGGGDRRLAVERHRGRRSVAAGGS
ncbi:MAG: hypothetical protein ACE368_06625 [Paracoccaceae bacterium]